MRRSDGLRSSQPVEETNYHKGTGPYYLLCVRPIFLEGRGVEAKLIFICEDDGAPEKSLCIDSMLRLSESTYIVGVTIRCLKLLVTPHFRSTAEAATRELANLPMQDFSWTHFAAAAISSVSLRLYHKEEATAYQMLSNSVHAWRGVPSGEEDDASREKRRRKR
ncbi:hypothetical protein HU200_035100 [Digitaria exilis]|uniref:Uncharacterized protein n=1 Tax=Digitaria exilis TaxID=1010633 RepID=A0A835EQ16_9POAL|nr:hypothetical protein HU200_035100 [Digitaria exilis]